MNGQEKAATPKNLAKDLSSDLFPFSNVGTI